jgi:chemotaxis protein MotB
MNIILFESGSAELNPAANEIITKIGLILKELPDNYIKVEGHTDNVPIKNSKFDSNWELSNSRATHVLKLLINNSGLDPSKLSPTGYGEYKPIASNDTVEERAKNRRVNIVIVKKKYDALETRQ